MSIDLRVKHDLESRRRAVELFDAGVGCKPAAEALSVPRETVREWQWVYRAFGSEALLSMGGKQSRYTFEQRVAAASAVVDGGMAKTDAMAEFGIRSKSPLERWCRLYREGGSAAASGTANAQKPVVFYNRQPSNSSTGELDMTTLKWNDDTYYVGFDAKQGGELEGQMVVEYIKAHAADIDRNGDGVIGYVLAIGDVGHNDSIARTRGCRKALGTAVEKDGQIVSDPVGTNTDGKSDKVKDGEIEVDGKKFKIRELASQEMKTSAGATWDAPTAGNALSGTWASAFGEQIDIVVSNNDGMGMSMYSNWAKENKVPVFGYDANSDAVAALGDTDFPYGGTISQNPAVQAYLTLRLLRNSLDGVDVNTGVGKADDAGNVIAEDDFKFSKDDRSFYAMNLEVTADNYKDFTDPANTLYETAQAQLDEKDSPKKKVWLSIYNSADNFLGSTYKPLLEKYAPLLNLDLEVVQGDGQNESSITNKLGNPADFDAFAINMVKTDNGASYTSILGQ